MAMLHGVIIGVAAVALIGFIIMNTGDKKTEVKEPDDTPETVPASSEADVPTNASGEPLELFAKQHGAFTTSASAASFITADPTLATAAIIKVGDQYFVWSAVGLTDTEIILREGEGTFRKRFLADPSACEVIGEKKLRDALSFTDIAKINSLISETDDKKTEDFNRSVASITAFTDDLQVIRLHLLAQYSYTKDCIKISF